MRRFLTQRLVALVPTLLGIKWITTNTITEMPSNVGASATKR